MTKKPFYSIILGGLLILLTSSCDSPPNRGALKLDDKEPFQETDAQGVAVDKSSATGSESSTVGSDSRDISDASSVVNNQNLTDELVNCSFSTDGNTGFAQTSSHIGDFNICRSTKTRPGERDIFFQVKIGINTPKLCIFPLFTDQGQSRFIGEPRCFLANDAGKVYRITMLKNRTNFTNLEINGAMIMKDEATFFDAPFFQFLLSPDAFIFCSQWLDQHNDPSYCESFRRKGAYVQVSF
ncbi:hypothetical protein HON22_03440 [Candidatus Peregrinibacteria bacterium]|nr:hypothetical protein [Candidatus Peregrinibacteria bacterium]